MCFAVKVGYGRADAVAVLFVYVCLVCPVLASTGCNSPSRMVPYFGTPTPLLRMQSRDLYSCLELCVCVSDVAGYLSVGLMLAHSRQVDH